MESTNTPKVTLVGWTTSMLDSGTQRSGAPADNLGPLRTIAIIWEQSKSTKSMDEVIDYVNGMSATELADLMERVLEGVPVVEGVTFNFVLENVSISWREQMVRHRVGSKVDARVGPDWQMIGVDVIPDNADMSAWSQSMRLLDMSQFADNGAFRTPDGVAAMDDSHVEEWANDMRTIQEMYAKWVHYGLEREDARDLIPLGATSRLSWSINLRTLQHIVGKRGCTILQLGLWGPVITGMINELAAKIHPVFRRLVTPPCLNGDKWTGCIFPEDNRRRLTGEDPNMGCCPLWIGRGSDTDAIAGQARAEYQAGTIRNRHLIDREAANRGVFWGRDPWNGNKNTK